MPTKVVPSMFKVSNSFILSVYLTLLCSSPSAYAWPWGDTSKYRNECYKACVEDSFGKAKVNEINQRCGNKCNSLPISPKDQWAYYDDCSVSMENHRQEMIKEEEKFNLTKDSCEVSLKNDLKKCEKEDWILKDFCRDKAFKSQSSECVQKSSAKFLYEYVAQYCIKPAIARPK